MEWNLRALCRACAPFALAAFALRKLARTALPPLSELGPRSTLGLEEGFSGSVFGESPLEDRDGRSSDLAWSRGSAFRELNPGPPAGTEG